MFSLGRPMVTSSNSTSLLMMIHSVFTSQSRWDWIALPGPRYIQILDLGSHLLLLPCYFTNARHLNTLRFSTDGFFPLHASSRVIPLRDLVLILFVMWVASVITLAQNLLLNFTCCSMHLAFSTRVQFFLSATLLCSGV